MFVFRPNFIPSAVVVIGCGGTGSRLVPPLVQLLRSCQQKNNPSGFLLAPIPLILVDGDTVEEKNLQRQNFSPRDVGLNKATALANRYSNAWGEPIYTVPRFVEGAGSLLSSIVEKPNPLSEKGVYHNMIFVLAVDSPSARRLLLRNIFANSGGSKAFIIDPGNEDDFGQVRCFTNSLVSEPPQAFLNRGLFDRIPERDTLEIRTSNIPIPVMSYLEMGTSTQEVSCAGLPQTLAINTMMASITLGIIQNFLFFKPFKYDCTRFSLVNGTSTESHSVHQWMRRGLPNGMVGPVGKDGGCNYSFPDGETLREISLSSEQEVFLGFFTYPGRVNEFDFSIKHYSGPDGMNVEPPSYTSRPNSFGLFEGYARKAEDTYAARGMVIEKGKIVPAKPKLVPVKEGSVLEALPVEAPPPKRPRRRTPTIREIAEAVDAESLGIAPPRELTMAGETMQDDPLPF